MTDYITIYGVRKRGFTIQARIPELWNTSVLITNQPDTRITRAGDTRITRDGNIRVARSVTTVYPRTLDGVRKRSFVVQTKVNHG